MHGREDCGSSGAHVTFMELASGPEDCGSSGAHITFIKLASGCKDCASSGAHVTFSMCSSFIQLTRTAFRKHLDISQSLWIHRTCSFHKTCLMLS